MASLEWLIVISAGAIFVLLYSVRDALIAIVELLTDIRDELQTIRLNAAIPLRRRGEDIEGARPDL